VSATVHAVVGPVGVGKTTYGRRWAAAHGAVHLVLDEWMRTLFMPDAPKPPSLEWMVPRVERCEAMIWTVTEQVARRGVPCLIELGLFRRDERDRLRAEAARRGLALQLHHLSAPAAVRAARGRGAQRRRRDLVDRGRRRDLRLGRGLLPAARRRRAAGRDRGRHQRRAEVAAAGRPLG
jgi:predicted kinase